MFVIVSIAAILSVILLSYAYLTMVRHRAEKLSTSRPSSPAKQAASPDASWAATTARSSSSTAPSDADAADAVSAADAAGEGGKEVAAAKDSNAATDTRGVVVEGFGGEEETAAAAPSPALLPPPRSPALLPPPPLPPPSYPAEDAIRVLVPPPSWVLSAPDNEQQHPVWAGEYTGHPDVSPAEMNQYLSTPDYSDYYNGRSAATVGSIAGSPHVYRL